MIVVLEMTAVGTDAATVVGAVRRKETLVRRLLGHARASCVDFQVLQEHVRSGFGLTVGEESEVYVRSLMRSAVCLQVSGMKAKRLHEVSRQERTSNIHIRSLSGYKRT